MPKIHKPDSLRNILQRLKTKISRKYSLTKAYSGKKSIDKQYKINSNLLGLIKRQQAATTAVIIHLYYVDSWELFRQALDMMSIEFDLFITVSPTESNFASILHRDYPNAHLLVVPNRGRDILPFLRVARELEKLGYKKVLKIHSKKSTHRTDGQDWLSSMIRSLIPEDERIQSRLKDLLEDPKTGIIGPKDQYIALKVNFEANGVHMTDILSGIYSSKTSHRILQVERAEHGFFSGTMFWARLDALSPILRQDYSVTKFEKEQGQIDATFAHAMERVFCLVPQVENKNLYEISPLGVEKIDYKTTNIPDWSEVYIGPKPEKRKRKKL
jgi:lipopolysaccharide biosynthesis protein